MSRAVTTGSTDQSIRVWAYNSSGAAITGEAYNSAGIAVSVVVRSAGRIVSTTALTLVARSGSGVHTDSAFTEVGSGEYVIDLADSYSATAGRQVTVTLTSTAISGGYVIAETLDVGMRAELDSATSAKITDINTFATRMTTGLAQDGLVWQFTANMLELAPSATGVEELQATQEEILALIDTYLTGVNAAAQDTPGTIAGFPSNLNIGDSYTDAMNNAITITLVDDQNNPVDTWGDYDVNHAGFTPSLVISGSGGKVTATVTYDTDHFLVEIPSSESLRASPGTATMQFVLKWYVADRLVAQKTIVTGQAVTWIKQI